MLQQTQVDRVLPRWELFMARFPTVEQCAAVPAGDIIALWDGLGYNRRAVMLHQTAIEVTEIHGGVFPSSIAELQKLPGIGPYTARAVIAFTEQGDVAPLDTNIGRILARLSGERLAPRAAQRLADHLVPAGQGWAWNQTLMDFGSKVCVKRAPACDSCGLSDLCGWHGNGEDPANRSAAVSGKQSRFDGSDRQGRGRLVKALRNGPVPRDEIAETMGWGDDSERAERVLATLVNDALVQIDAGVVALPGRRKFPSGEHHA